MNESRKNLFDALQQLGEIQEEIEQTCDKDATELWNSLSVDKQMLLFYYIIKQISDAELKDDFETYRTILYDRFGFPSESYQIGMMCRFMELHNSIIRPSDQSDYRQFIRERLQNAKKRTDY
jgi:hypothetical protein